MNSKKALAENVSVFHSVHKVFATHKQRKVKTVEIMSDEVKKEIERLLSLDNRSKYMFLDRMRSDCSYYLGNGHREDKNLYGGNVADHITYMKILWNSFTQEEKPEWLTMEQIKEFEREMKAEV